MNCWCCCQLGDLKASFFPITATLPLIKRFCRPVSCFEKHVFSSLPLYNRQSQRLLWKWQIGCGHESDQKQISSQAQYHIKTFLKHGRGCYIRRKRILIFLGGMCWYLFVLEGGQGFFCVKHDCDEWICVGSYQICFALLC